MNINKSIYEGYLCYSDAKEPQVYNNEEFELEISDTKNPFVIEGQLYDGLRSISIKFVDGKYIVNEYKLNDLKGVEYSEHVFYGNRMDGRQLKFRQYWREECDDLCEKMAVLQPKELVFVGFKNKED